MADWAAAAAAWAQSGEGEKNAFVPPPPPPPKQQQQQYQEQQQWGGAAAAHEQQMWFVQQHQHAFGQHHTQAGGDSIAPHSGDTAAAFNHAGRQAICWKRLSTVYDSRTKKSSRPLSRTSTYNFLLSFLKMLPSCFLTWCAATLWSAAHSYLRINCKHINWRKIGEQKVFC